MQELALKEFIMAGWTNRIINHLQAMYCLHDGANHYFLSRQVIDFTNHILLEYGTLYPSNEGMVYWCGNIIKNRVNIFGAIAPDTSSDYGRVTVLPISNFHVVKALSEKGMVHLGQVHSHPENWVDHSHGDNEWASFKKHGLISIVVPYYGKKGLLPLTKCGVHIYKKAKFKRMEGKYVKKHFHIVDDSSVILDLRNKNDGRWKKTNGTN